MFTPQWSTYMLYLFDKDRTFNLSLRTHGEMGARYINWSMGLLLPLLEYAASLVNSTKGY